MVVRDFVQQTVFLIDAARPLPAERSSQAFWFSRTRERVSEYVVNQPHDSQGQATVGSNPVFKVVY